MYLLSLSEENDAEMKKLIFPSSATVGKEAFLLLLLEDIYESQGNEDDLLQNFENLPHFRDMHGSMI